MGHQPIPEHRRPDGVDDATVEALGKLSEAFEVAEDARGHLYGFHRLTGMSDLALGEAVDLLRDAGHAALADEVWMAVCGVPLALRGSEAAARILTLDPPDADPSPKGPIMLDLTSLSDLSALAARLPVRDDAAAAAARARQAELTKPPGSLGRLEELAEFMAGWRGTPRPRIDRAQALVMAGNHGVCAQGIAVFPTEVTKAMVTNFAAGGAAINQLCRVAGAELSVVPIELDRPTADFTQGPAMTEAETLDAISRGAAAVDPAADVLLLGEMGIGNSTVSAALALALLGGSAEDWVGPGAGADAAMLARKADIVAAGAARHAGLGAGATLAALGGREQAAICGAVLAARAARVPVILDGFICTAAVLPLHVADPALLDHCLIAHRSAEPGHRRMIEAMAKVPLLDLGMRLGEGSGAAVALSLVRHALAAHDGMATFAEAGIG